MAYNPKVPQVFAITGQPTPYSQQYQVQPAGYHPAQQQPYQVQPTGYHSAQVQPYQVQSHDRVPSPVQEIHTNPDGTRMWGSHLCSCCDDIGICCLGVCCFPILAREVAVKQDENCCVPLLVPGGLIALRTKLRTTEKIEGSICGDCCAMICCGLCATCQMARELKYIGDKSK